MTGWTVSHASGLLGALLGAGVAYALVVARLTSLAARHREELTAQQRALNASFLDVLRSSVVEIREQAQVRLLGLIFNHLAEECLPAYQEARDLCDGWSIDDEPATHRDFTCRLGTIFERSTRAVAGIAKILDDNRYHDEICTRFGDAASQANPLLAGLGSAVQALSGDSPGIGNAESRSEHEALEQSVTQFGQWIKQSMTDAARMQNALMSGQSAASPAESDDDQGLDLII